MTLFKKEEPLEKGTMLFSGKALLTLIVPLFVQQVLNVAVGTADSIMVASAGEVAVSGVSLINTLDTLLIIFFTAMVAGGSVVVAQTMGRKNPEEVSAAAKQLLYITTFLAMILTVVVVTFRKPLLMLLFGDAEPDVMANAEIYFFYVAISFPLLAINESIGAVFRSAGNTFISLAVTFAINLVNIGGNAVLIMGFGMGAAGAAIATSLARLVGTAILLTLILCKKFKVYIDRVLHYKPDFKIIKKILYIGVPNGVENTMFQFGRLLTQSLISTMGTAVIAANAVALTIANFQYMTGTACSAAMIAVVGRCIGAHEERQAKHYSRVILGINYGAMWLVSLAIMVLMNPIISAYELSGTSSELTKQLIIYHAIFASLIWPIGFMLPSAFRAASDVRFTMVVSMTSMWAFRVILGYVMALESVSVFGLFTVPGLGMGVMGVWVAMTIDWVFRATLYLIRYVSGRWLRVRRTA